MSTFLPRPLKFGEFFCHKCNKFVPTSDYDKHRKECLRKVVEAEKKKGVIN